MSPSDDMRFLGSMSLEPENITDYPPPGNLAGVVGLAVGFGSNFLNAIYAEKRLILNNGSHRAYALRDLGIARVPCIVQHISSRTEVSVLASTAITDAPRSEEHTSELQSRQYLVCRLLLEKKKINPKINRSYSIVS